LTWVDRWAATHAASTAFQQERTPPRHRRPGLRPPRRAPRVVRTR
jgi:hypothetical protein